MDTPEILNQNFDSILFFSTIISLITFFFWCRTGSQVLSYFSGLRNGRNINNSNNNSNSNNNNSNNNFDNIDFSESNSNSTSNDSNNNSNINNENINSNTQTTVEATPIIQPIERPTEPYQENFTSDIDDLVKINIIQSETVYHRTFRQSKILKVYDLKKYFYPKEIQDNKRILFIYNGRAMIDNHFLSTHPNLLNGINGPGFVHCLIKNPLTADQVDNNGSGGSYYNNSYGFVGSNSNGSHYVGGNADGRRYSQNGYNNNDFFTWMCTKTLFGLTGLFLALLWCLQFTNPKLFNLFSSIMLFIFTFFWGIGFYSSLKPINYQQQQQSQQQPNTHLHND
ncbi:hypothetical protein RB653_004566 [Dictyostelium firmibasis]|uniref:Uncharacterized protein n=1 Tax=Dictyostelium firmibasis TaxID=79012 RepID=A0AAN7YXD1_9MYCE